VAVADSTYRATSRIFEFEPLTAASVKGKNGSSPALAREGRSFSLRFRHHPTVHRAARRPRARELVGTFERAVQPRMAFKLSSAPFVSTDSWKSECRVEASILIVTS
jgi:hypothetical protein